MAKKAKISITLPHEVLKEVNMIARRSGENRSAVILKAVQMLIKKPQQEEDSRRYVEAYRKHPESQEELRASEKIASRICDPEDKW